MKGVVIENSLKDLQPLKEVEIIRSWKDGNWKINEIEVSKAQATNFANYLNSGPWYIHFWEPDNDEVLVIFKNKSFIISYSDKKTWKDAITYGKSIGIPIEQLDFPIN